MGILDIVPAGVVTGKNVYKIFEYGKAQKEWEIGFMFKNSSIASL
jgi:hypothetical protein